MPSAGRHIGIAIAAVVAALIILDVAGPQIGRLTAGSPLPGEIAAGLALLYIVGTIVAANRRVRPRARRPRPVRRGPSSSAADFIDAFERRQKR